MDIQTWNLLCWNYKFASSSKENSLLPWWYRENENSVPIFLTNFVTIVKWRTMQFSYRILCQNLRQIVKNIVPCGGTFRRVSYKPFFASIYLCLSWSASLSTTVILLTLAAAAEADIDPEAELEAVPALFEFELFDARKLPPKKRICRKKNNFSIF